MFKVVKNFFRRLLLQLRDLNYSVRVSENNPRDNEIEDDEIVIVGSGGYYKWAYIKCPCGCCDTISLSLMQKFSPSWKLKFDSSHRISLYPSIWKIAGCRSHFWIRDGKIEWSLSEWESENSFSHNF